MTDADVQRLRDLARRQVKDLDGEDLRLAKQWELGYERWQAGKGRRFRYIPNPSFERIHASEAYLKCAIGPVGNGKTMGMLADVAMCNLRQLPQYDGVVRDRAVFVRETVRELVNTVFMPWMRMFPSTVVYNLKKQPEAVLVRTIRGVRYELEIQGYGMDRTGAEDQIRSDGFSIAFGNEAQFLNRNVIDALIERCGRYPDKYLAPAGWESDPRAWIDRKGKKRWFRDFGVRLDSNAPPEGTWLWRKAWGGEVDESGLEVYFIQPPAMFAVWDTVRERWAFEPNVGQRKGIAAAENIENLTGGWEYYENKVILNGADYAFRWICNIPPKTLAGTPVFTNFAERWHVPPGGVEWPKRGRRLFGGVDFGRTPRCVLSGGIGARGRVECFDEGLLDGGTALDFGTKVLLPMVVQHGFEPWEVTLYCDPAGRNPTENSNIVAIEQLCSLGFNAMSVPYNNNLQVRLDAVNRFLSKICGETGGIVFDKGRCVNAIRALSGGYCWERHKRNGEWQDGDKPDKKSAHSHIADAVENLCVGLIYGGLGEQVGPSRGGYVDRGGVLMPESFRAGEQPAEAMF